MTLACLCALPNTRGDDEGDWISLFDGKTLNGKKVLRIGLRSDDRNKHVADSRFRDIPQFADSRKGHVALQDHGYRVWYRGIRIRRLPAKQKPRP